jgi:transcription-repair coupling factor (superfamily II helicase)
MDMQRTDSWGSALRALEAQVGEGSGRRRRVQGLKGGARAFFVHRIVAEHSRPSVVVLPNAKEAERFLSDVRFFFGEEEERSPLEKRVHYFPSWDVVPFEDMSPPADVVAARIEGLYHLRQSRNPIIITTPESLLQRVPPLAHFGSRHVYLVEREVIDRDGLGAQLIRWGYQRVPLVEDRGDFCLRGNIIDVFPPAHPNPVRIQLDADTIEAMHEFDPVSQRLLRPQAELLLLPVREFCFESGSQRELTRRVEARMVDLEVSRKERNLALQALGSAMPFPGIELYLPYFYEHLDPVFAYLPQGALIWLDRPAEVDAAAEQLWADVERRAGERAAEHRFFPPPESLYVSISEWNESLRRQAQIELEPLDLVVPAADDSVISVRSFTTEDLKVGRAHQRHEVSFAPVADRVRTWCTEGYRVFFAVATDAQAQRLARLFDVNQVTAEIVSTAPSDALSVSSPRPQIVLGHLSEGFRLPDERLVVVTEGDVFGETPRRASRRISVAQLLKSLSELNPDDYIVHLDHGVGVYRGLKHLRVAGTEGDYLHLEYADGDRLYVPVDRITLVQKYVGADGEAPALDKLGGSAWDRVKAKTRESVLAMARELLEIYAAREVHERPACSPPDAYFREFEATFPFEETPDQRQAIDDTISDLHRPKPMDRLICGDVGYGKTEVALRAAFLAGMEGRQVAVLVPTTVLAQQHLATFRRRLEGYPVRVEMLSRFLTPAQSREVLHGLRTGNVDIVIGTHRLLQKDVEFKRLGLLVIDEEHRFGVRQKERIKEMRKLVDVLTLTATPIPRTLQMSLTGIRDLSVIETPPVDRLAVRTYVTRYDDDVIREAVLRELRRQGQVFFVHNRVENIDVMAKHLRTLLPEARLAVAHGQMPERELERVMLSFLARGIDMLVCSAIIESGLDIPNANTIIINRADHFGLAQLYQLRGRVGRSHERAYAYLMIPGEHLISRDAHKRLQVLQELDDLGGGFRLAARDLEIRGAGNLLGKQQSGHITAVGFELYTQMMEEAVRELRGEQMLIEVEPEIQLGIPAYLPESYVPDEHQRLSLYRRLAAIKGKGDLDDIAAELQERFGPIPPLVDSLLRIMDLRRTLKDCMVVRASLQHGVVNVQFHPEAPVNVDDLVLLVQEGKGRYRLSADFQLSLTPENRDWDGMVSEVQSVLVKLNQPFRGAA